VNDPAAEILRRGQRLTRLANHSGKPRPTAERAANFAAERSLCHADIHHWLDEWGWIQDPKAQDSAERVIPFRAWPRQVEYVDWLLDGAERGAPRVLNKSREVGATWVALMVLYWLWLTSDHFYAHLASRKEPAVDDLGPKSLFGKLAFIARTQPSFLRPAKFSLDKNRKKLHLENPANGSLITGEGLSHGFSRGDRVGVLLTDEWAHVPHHLQQQIRLGIESVARSWWAISTPNGRGDDFHSRWRLAAEADRFEIGWEDDPRKSRGWYDALLVSAGGQLTEDERAQEHGRSFVGVSGERVWRAARAAVTYRERPPHFDHLPILGAMDFGSGPSLTVLALARIEWAEGSPIIWLERVRTWQRWAAAEVGAEIVAMLPPGTMAHIVGDPSGIAADSSQSSWEKGLRGAGVPFRCLPADYNTRTGIDDSLRDVQRQLDGGGLRIHAEDASLALDTIESWQYDIPEGMPLDLVNRKEISPRKDAWSHVGDALRYLVSCVLRQGLPSEDSEVEAGFEAAPMTEVGAILDMYRRAGL
jgi:hypothetical protein